MLLAAPIPADVDECSLEYSPCSQLCSNTPGGFSCSCLPGYTLWHSTTCEVSGRESREARDVWGLRSAPAIHGPTHWVTSPLPWQTTQRRSWWLWGRTWPF